jgi:hypothetical protein
MAAGDLRTRQVDSVRSTKGYDPIVADADFAARQRTACGKSSEASRRSFGITRDAIATRPAVTRRFRGVDPGEPYRRAIRAAQRVTVGNRQDSTGEQKINHSQATPSPSRSSLRE